MPMLQTLQSHLDAQHVPYEVIHHRQDFTAQETAAHTHTPGRMFAKTVILNLDHKFCMFVLPANDHIDFEKVRRELKAQNVRLADEYEIARICPDCEPGAMPPFGNFYKMPIYVSHRMTEDYMITFNAGTHQEVMRMLYRDYDRLAHPIVANFTIDH